MRDIDLALHLPLRYEDETRLTPIADLRDGDTAQIEGRVRDAQVIMDSLRDEKIADCVSRAVNGAEVGGTGRGSAAISLE